jgi:hypothetical protein
MVEGSPCVICMREFDDARVKRQRVYKQKK